MKETYNYVCIAFKYSPCIKTKHFWSFKSYHMVFNRSIVYSGVMNGFVAHVCSFYNVIIKMFVSSLDAETSCGPAALSTDIRPHHHNQPVA